MLLSPCSAWLLSPLSPCISEHALTGGSCGFAGCLASVAVASDLLPPKLNAIIQPLMGGVRRETEPLLQHDFAGSLARMLQLAANRTPCPNDK